MRTILTTTATLLALAVPAWAQDADGDGNVTLAELQAVYPDITAETFGEMDTDGDGVLSAGEMQAATEAGLLPG